MSKQPTADKAYRPTTARYLLGCSLIGAAFVLVVAALAVLAG